MLLRRDRAPCAKPSAAEFSGMRSASPSHRLPRRWEGWVVLAALLLQSSLATSLWSDALPAPGSTSDAQPIVLAGDLGDTICSLWDWLFGGGEESPTPPPPPPNPPEGGGW